MNWRGFFRACLACFQGDKDVVSDIKNASYVSVWQHKRIMDLMEERVKLTTLRASLRRRKKRHTHLDPRLVEITTELLRLEREG